MAAEPPGLGRRRLVEAAAWRVRLSEAGRDTSPELETWLNEDPANRGAWAHAEAIWRGWDDIAALPEILARRSEALDRARRAYLGRTARRQARRRAVAASLLLALAVGGVAGWRVLQPQQYETGAGERRVVELSDGSVVTLDSASRLQVRYTARARDLVLDRGQARFDVAHNALRPFRVTAAGRTVIATGTSFNVELLGPKVLVTLIEGRVTVLAGPGAVAAGASWPVSLSAGQRLTAQARAPVEVARVDTARVTAWQAGKLVFDDEPLSLVVQRVSRHTARPVSVADADAAALRISGVFTAGDVTTFVDTLTQYLPVEAERRPDGAVLIRSCAVEDF